MYKNPIILGISNIGRNLSKETISTLLILFILAYISIIIISLTKKGKKYFSFIEIVKFSLLFLTFISNIIPTLFIEIFKLERPSSFFLWALPTIVGVLLMVIIDNMVNKFRYTIAIVLLYNFLITLIFIYFLPNKADENEKMAFDNYSGNELLELYLDREILDSITQIEFAKYVINDNDVFEENIWKAIVISVFNEPGEISNLEFEEKERLFVEYFQQIDGNIKKLDRNKLSKIGNEKDYFIRYFIRYKYFEYVAKNKDQFDKPVRDGDQKLD